MGDTEPPHRFVPVTGHSSTTGTRGTRTRTRTRVATVAATQPTSTAHPLCPTTPPYSAPSYEAPAPSYNAPSYNPPCAFRRTFGNHGNKDKDKDKNPCTAYYRL